MPPLIALVLLGPEVAPARRREPVGAARAAGVRRRGGRRVAVITLVPGGMVMGTPTLLRSETDDVLPVNTLTEPVLIAKLARLRMSINCDGDPG